MKGENTKEIVREGYARIANGGGGCGSCGCCGGNKKVEVDIAKSIGYSDEEIGSVPDANLGLGCGNPVALSRLSVGETVLDLGSGAGFDCFLAAKKLAGTGKVIGVDMTEEMIERARANAKKYGYKNVEFRLGEIEALPVEDESVDVILSNCVINLSPDKAKVFAEAYRVLRSGGKMFVSDIVLTEELSDDVKNDPDLLVGCVAGALLKEDYLSIARDSGFSVKILGEDKAISKRQYLGMPVESLKIEATKI